MTAPRAFILGGDKSLTCQQVGRMCERIQRDTGFDEKITPVRFRTTVLTDLYDQPKDLKQTQQAAGHANAATAMKHYVKGRAERANTAVAIATVYGVR
ncbi:MAG: tyrosine-type recombinase/integrase [Aristaeellaceae bacterium]